MPACTKMKNLESLRQQEGVAQMRSTPSAASSVLPCCRPPFRRMCCSIIPACWSIREALVCGTVCHPGEKMGQNHPKDSKKKTKAKKASGVDSATMNLISGFTVLRFTGMLGMRNVSFTKEELLKMNASLNKIRKK